MMRPQRCFIMAGSTCWHAKKAACRLICRTRSQSSRFMRTARPSRVTPALLTSTSMRPNRSSTLPKPSRIESNDSRFIFTARTCPLQARIFSTNSSFFSISGEAGTISKPARHNVKAISRPIPRLAPVTTATRLDIVSPIIMMMF